jgi:hypothetical protein
MKPLDSRLVDELKHPRPVVGCPAGGTAGRIEGVKCARCGGIGGILRQELSPNDYAWRDYE